MTSAATYQRRRELGQCTQCERMAQTNPKTGEPMTLCGVCSEGQIERAAERKAERLSAGLCPHCGQVPTEGRKTCSEWREADKRYHQTAA